MTPETNRPTHRVYAVIKTAGRDRGHWAEIGAVWPHKDGKGFAVKLYLTPIDPNTEIVIREPRATGDAS